MENSSKEINVKGTGFYNSKLKEMINKESQPPRTFFRSKNNIPTSAPSESENNEVPKVRALLLHVMKSQDFNALLNYDECNALKITITNDGEKFAARVKCPVSECQQSVRIYMDVRTLKNGSSCRWIVSNFKKHLYSHLNVKAGPSSKTIPTLFEQQKKKQRLMKNQPEDHFDFGNGVIIEYASQDEIEDEIEAVTVDDELVYEEPDYLENGELEFREQCNEGDVPSNETPTEESGEERGEFH
jgi:hypothetical protein